MDTFGKLTREYRNNRGVAIVFVAVMIVVLIAFVGLAVDMGYVYFARGQLQNAADAGALAGAAKLDGTNSTSQAAARSEAKAIAERNTIVPSGTNVQIASDDTNTLSSTNDITVGNWDSTLSPKYLAGRTPINAVQVRARKTSDSPGGQVGIFFAKVIGWSRMSASGEGTAVRQGIASPAIVICTQTCNKSVPFDLYLQDNTPGNDHSYAWTVFSSKEDKASVNTNDVRKLIRGESVPPNNLCGKCILTDNGVTNAQTILAEAYADIHFDPADKVISGGNVLSWKIAVPVVDYNCEDETVGGCPPSKQGSNKEPYHVSGMAIMEITDVRSTSYGNEKGLTVNSLQCIPCPITYDDLDKIAHGKRYVYLVK